MRLKKIVEVREGRLTRRFFGHQAVPPYEREIPDYWNLFRVDLDSETQQLQDPSTPEEMDENAWLFLRNTRNALLQESDWTQVGDIPVAIKEAWLPYRQALRDLPNTTVDPKAVAWPEAPLT